MIRLMGAALVITATGLMGARGIWRLRRRTAVLEGLIVSLQLMESEICSRLSPMREVLEKLAREAPENVRRLYKNAVEGMSCIGRCSFYAIWKGAVERSRELLLTQEEAETLTQLGLCLGRYDVREQAETILRVRRQLEFRLRRAQEERDRDTKLHAFFGVASGLFAVIILL